MTLRRRLKLVAAALCRRRGRILLTRRRRDQPMPLYWELPGGKVECGEAPVAALRRELAEELDVDVVVGRVYDVVHHRYADFDLLMLVYRCRLRGNPRPLDVAALRWVEPGRLAGYKLLPADVVLAKRLARRPRVTTRKMIGGTR